MFSFFIFHVLVLHIVSNFTYFCIKLNIEAAESRKRTLVWEVEGSPVCVTWCTFERQVTASPLTLQWTGRSHALRECFGLSRRKGQWVELNLISFLLKMCCPSQHKTWVLLKTYLRNFCFLLALYPLPTILCILTVLQGLVEGLPRSLRPRAPVRGRAGRSGSCRGLSGDREMRVGTGAWN